MSEASQVINQLNQPSGATSISFRNDQCHDEITNRYRYCNGKIKINYMTRMLDSPGFRVVFGMTLLMAAMLKANVQEHRFGFQMRPFKVIVMK